MTPQEKINKACGLISIKHPFFACFLVRMNVIEEPRCPTMMTDGRTIWWGPAFVERCTVEEVQGVLVHEIFHIVFKHHLRRNEREPRKWNIACDYVIDPMVLSSNFKLPNWPGLEQHHDKQYDGKSAEQVYELIPDPPPQQGGKGQGDPNGQGDDGQAGGSGEPFEQDQGLGGVCDMKNEDGSDMSQSEKDFESTNVEQMTIIAADAAKKQGKLPGGIEGYVNSLRESQVPWQDVLRRFVGGEHPDDYSFRRPHRGQYHLNRMWEPSIEKNGVGHIVIAIDTSGSMSNRELEHALAECNAVSEEFMPEMITVIYADSKVQKVEEYEAGNVIERLNIKGRGGTRVRPAIDYAEENIPRVDRFIYITDMEFSDYGQPPYFPVLWVGTTDARPEYGDFARLRVDRR